jgi:hypothetical protein
MSEDNDHYLNIIEALRQTRQTLPNDYRKQYTALLEIRKLFHAEVASALAPVLNEYAKQQPQTTVDERRELAASINNDLRSLGMTLKCPKTGLPVTMIVDTQDAAHPDVSRFRLERRDDRGRKIRTFTSGDLPDLELMEDPPRIEGGSRSFLDRRHQGPNR